MRYDIVLLAVISSILVSSSQVLLKIGANKYGKSELWKQYINFYVLTAYTLFGFVTIINIHIFSVFPLNFSSLMIALSYIMVAIISRLFLKEKLTKNIIIGLCFTLTGIVLFSLGL